MNLENPRSANTAVVALAVLLGLLAAFGSSGGPAERMLAAIVSGLVVLGLGGFMASVLCGAHRRAPERALLQLNRRVASPPQQS